MREMHKVSAEQVSENVEQRKAHTTALPSIVASDTRRL